MLRTSDVLLLRPRRRGAQLSPHTFKKVSRFIACLLSLCQTAGRVREYTPCLGKPRQRAHINSRYLSAVVAREGDVLMLTSTLELARIDNLHCLLPTLRNTDRPDAGEMAHQMIAELWVLVRRTQELLCVSRERLDNSVPR